MSLSTPVALMIFNRPALTKRILDELARARPQRLFVVADGPRPNRAADPAAIAATRAFLEHVDWPCEVTTNFSDVNLGCKLRISSGLDWVFEQVEAAIILEDDCLPHADFFPFCQELLERYQNDSRVMAISGGNFQQGRERPAASYYFSKYFHCWGWATWRRAWKSYDVDMNRWPDFRDASAMEMIADSPEELAHWLRVFERQYQGLVDTWDYQFTFAMWAAGGLSIVPSVNLISNIGFGSDATHTTGVDHPWANLPTSELGTLRHPHEIQRCRPADIHTFQTAFAKRRRGLRKFWAQMRDALAAFRRQRLAREYVRTCAVGRPS